MAIRIMTTIKPMGATAGICEVWANALEIDNVRKRAETANLCFMMKCFRVLLPWFPIGADKFGYRAKNQAK